MDPQGQVIVSVYSSGAIGRLVPEDVTGLVRYAREHAPASALTGRRDHAASSSRAGPRWSPPRPARPRLALGLADAERA